MPIPVMAAWRFCSAIWRGGRCGEKAGVHPDMMSFRGPAVIFESQEEACEGILAGKVKSGDVVVIRNEGPKGGPGMQEMLAPTSYIMGQGPWCGSGAYYGRPFFRSHTRSLYWPYFPGSGGRRPDRPAEERGYY